MTSNYQFFLIIFHNIASSPRYATMVDISKYELSHSYLEMELEVESYINTFHNFWDEYGCTLMCDV